MAMVGRGLLRLWVVLALFWVAAKTWLLWNELTTTALTFTVTTSDNKQFEMQTPAGSTKEEVREAFRDYVAGKTAPPGDPVAISEGLVVVD
jgi:hypothetical protein